MAFDFITEFKKLCAQLQKEDIIVYLEQAKQMNDKDQELQDLIGEFNLVKYNLTTEMSKADRNEDTVNELDAKLNDLYDKIMENESMIAYNEAKYEVDQLTKYMQAVITATVNGGDPMAVQPPMEGCSGSCSTCSGCH